MALAALTRILPSWKNALRALAAAGLLVVAVPVCGLLSPLRTQSVYLSLATFHAYLELCARAGEMDA